MRRIVGTAVTSPKYARIPTSHEWQETVVYALPIREVDLGTAAETIIVKRSLLLLGKISDGAKDVRYDVAINEKKTSIPVTCERVGSENPNYIPDTDD